MAGLDFCADRQTLKIMRVIAWLSLFFGYIGLLILDGQTFSHAVTGIICGIIAIASGLACARRDHAKGGRRWGGWGTAILGLGLVAFCILQLPSSYKFQKRFNMRSKEHQERNRANPAADFHALGLEDADEARTLFGMYKHVFTTQVSEDYWEDTGPHKPSVHHFNATVIKTYQGDWNPGEAVSFSYDTDMPGLTVSNAFVGTNMLLLTYGHSSNEIPFGLGDFFIVDSNVQQVLQHVFPDNK